MNKINEINLDAHLIMYKFNLKRISTKEKVEYLNYIIILLNNKIMELQLDMNINNSKEIYNDIKKYIIKRTEINKLIIFLKTQYYERTNIEIN